MQQELDAWRQLTPSIGNERTVLAQADGTSLQDPHVFVLAF